VPRYDTTYYGLTSIQYNDPTIWDYETDKIGSKTNIPKLGNKVEKWDFVLASTSVYVNILAS